MSLADLSVNFFVALFALIDPVGNVPVFAAATIGATSAGRRRLALYIALFSFVFLTLFFFSGVAILKFFGVSLAAFRIAGGILLFIMGLDMARNDFTTRFVDVGDSGPQSTGVYARERFERLVVPFAMPLLIGPGAISTVVIYSSESRSFGPAGWAAGVGVIAAVSVTILACFWLTGLISRLLGRIGMTIVVRVLGLILCAMAVQFVIVGVGEATHNLVRAAAATPYPATP
jgi:multiple antibiotic resistance protein